VAYSQKLTGTNESVAHIRHRITCLQNVNGPHIFISNLDGSSNNIRDK